VHTSTQNGSSGNLREAAMLILLVANDTWEGGSTQVAAGTVTSEAIWTFCEYFLTYPHIFENGIYFYRKVKI
jgi:hypothetical protein